MASDGVTTAALLLLAGAVVAGSALAALAMRERTDGPRRFPLAALAHGSLGVAGFGLLLIAVQGPARGVRTGTASFGIVATVLFGIAILLGLAIRTWCGRDRPMPGLLVSAHAGVAITGFTILMAWVGLD